MTQEERAKIELTKAKKKETSDTGDKTRGKKEDEEEEEEGIEAVPPACYVKLLMNINQEVLTGLCRKL